MSHVKIEYNRELQRALAVIRERVADNFKNRLPSKELSCYRCYSLGVENYVVGRTSITSHYKSKQHREQFGEKKVQICLCNKYFWAEGPLDELYFLRHIFFCLLQARLPPGIHDRFGTVTTMIIERNSADAYSMRQAFLRDTPCVPPVSLPPISTEFILQPQQRPFFGDTSPNMHFIDSQPIDKGTVPLTPEEVSMETTVSTTATICTNTDAGSSNNTLVLPAEDSDTLYASFESLNLESLDHTDELSEKDCNMLNLMINQNSMSFRVSMLNETLQKVLNTKKISNFDRIKLDVLNKTYQVESTRDVRQEKRRVQKRFMRFFLDFTKKYNIEHFTCTICKPNIQMQFSCFMEHNLSHSRHVNQDVRCCCICGTYFFLHNTLNLYNPNYFYHICKCVTGRNISDDGYFFQRFLHICSCFNFYFDPNNELSSIYESKDIDFVPNMDNWIEVLQKMKSAFNSKWYVDRQIDDVFGCNFMKSKIMQIDDVWTNLNNNPDVETHIINDRKCFSCGPEIRQATKKSINDALENKLLVKRFGSNSFFLSRPKPHWLVNCSFIEPNVFEEELLDSTKCGLTLWIVRLANILGKSQEMSAGSECRPYFVHMFLYATNYALILKHLSNNSDIYILPHTCLCGKKSDLLDPLNVHRHLIVVYRNRCTMNRSNKELQKIRQRDVHLDGLDLTNIDTEATQRVRDYLLAGVKLKIKYVVNITCPLHFLNTINYVSSEKTFNLFQLNYKLKNDDNVMTLADIKNEISNMNHKTINSNYVVNPNLMEMAYDEALSENEEEDLADKQKEEIDPVVMKQGDVQESHVYHLYISKPVCSHFQSLSFLMFPHGIHALVNNHSYHFELLNAIVRNMKRMSCNVAKTKYQVHYVILEEVNKYIFNFCQYHVLPILKKMTKVTCTEAVNQLRLMGANLGCSDENNWPVVLMQDVISTKVILDHHITTRALEIRRSNNLCVSKILDYKRKYDVSQARLRLLIERCELRCREAIRENQEISNTSNSRASINELQKKIVAFKELLKSDVVLNENLMQKCKIDELTVKLSDSVQAYNILKQKYNMLNEKLQKIESPKKRKLADQYVRNSPTLSIDSSGGSTTLSVTPSINNLVNSHSPPDPNAQSPVFWCDAPYTQNNTQAVITPCKIMGSTVKPMEGPSQLMRTVMLKPDESSQMMYTISPLSNNVSPSIGVPTTNASN